MNAKIWGRWVSRLFQQRRRVRGLVARPAALAFESLEDRVAPATISWTGGGTNDNWANAANWNLGRAPVAGDDLIFGTLAPAAERTTVDNLERPAGLQLDHHRGLGLRHQRLPRPRLCSRLAAPSTPARTWAR